MGVSASGVLILGLLALLAPAVASESLDVRLVSLDPPSVSRGDVVTIVIETTPDAVCGGTVVASARQIEVGASVTLPSYPAFFGRWAGRFRTALVSAYYTITVTCALGDRKGQLVAHVSAS